MLLSLALLGIIGLPTALAQHGRRHLHLDLDNLLPSGAAAPVSSLLEDIGNVPSLAASLQVNAPESTHSSSNATCAYWLEDIKHQGVAAFNSDPGSYQVFRNVRDFGAKGDGATDDTAAIQAAIASGGRCAPGVCQSSTTTPAIVYFPAGTYMISTNIIDYYYTQMIGNPNCMPIIRASANFTNGLGGAAIGLIDADPYMKNGSSGYQSTNVFFRQIRNFILDLTLISPNSTTTGIHWPLSQSTSLQNIVFKLSDAPHTQQSGLYIEQGSGGFLSDLIFYGGRNAMSLGNQQFTMRNLTFYNSVTAIDQIWDWSWTYKNINIINCSVGLNMSAGGTSAQAVGSVTLLDSIIRDTSIGVMTAHNSSSSAGSLVLENVQLENVPVAIKSASGVTLKGTEGNTTIAAWGQGHEYYPTGPLDIKGPIRANTRPSSLLSGDAYYERSKPLYESYSTQSFISARSAGATGDGTTDDTQALQAAIIASARQNKILFLDHGDYKVTSTVYVPGNAKIVGESFSVILASGSYFSNMDDPKPVLQVGYAGESGTVELSDMIMSTQGPTAGAILVEYNLASPSGHPSGLWEFHARIGGFAGSDLQVYQCPITPNITTPQTPVNTDCIAAYLTMHVTKSATGLYMENDWLWVADHDLDEGNSTQITIYAGRGLLIESEAGAVWLLGTAVEHHTKYQYQLVNTKDIFMGLIQIEIPYYQPNPNASFPFPYVASLYDPEFSISTNIRVSNTSNASVPSTNAWGLRIVDSHDVYVYGASLYSFFNNYSTACDTSRSCQTRVFSVEGLSYLISIYNLNTFGIRSMITLNEVDVALHSNNYDGSVDTIALFRSE